jgi:hypothetical protein
MTTATKDYAFLMTQQTQTTKPTLRGLLKETPHSLLMKEQNNANNN